MPLVVGSCLSRARCDSRSRRLRRDTVLSTVSFWPTEAVPHFRRKLSLEMRGCSRERQLTGFVANSHYRPMLLKNATFGRGGIAASVQRERIGSRGSFFCLGDPVLRQFRLPCLSLLVLLGTTTSPFVASSARSPPEETRREHHSAHAGAVDRASECA